MLFDQLAEDKAKAIARGWIFNVCGRIGVLGVNRVWGQDTINGDGAIVS